MNQWYRVRGTAFHLSLAPDGEVDDALQLRSRKGRAAEIKLALTDGEQRLEGNTLYVGARGLATIIAVIHGARPNMMGKAVHRRLCDLFAGDPLFTEMVRGTIRAACGWPAVGEAAFWRNRAGKQLDARPFQRVHVSVREMEGCASRIR